MRLDWFQISLIWEALFIISVLYGARKIILSRIYGIRFKQWLILDTGESGYGILNKTLNEWDILGQKRSVAYDRIYKGWLFYTHDNAENLTLKQISMEYDYYPAYTAYCNTEEYNTNMKTKIFQMLLYVLEKNYIIMILFGVIIAIVIAAYGVYQSNQEKEILQWVVWKLNQTQQTGAYVGKP